MSSSRIQMGFEGGTSRAPCQPDFAVEEDEGKQQFPSSLSSIPQKRPKYIVQRASAFFQHFPYDMGRYMLLDSLNQQDLILCRSESAGACFKEANSCRFDVLAPISKSKSLAIIPVSTGCLSSSHVRRSPLKNWKSLPGVSMACLCCWMLNFKWR